MVTGAASGLGAATARELASLGARVVVADLDSDRGEALAAEIGGVFRATDVSDADQVSVAVAAAAERAPLRVLVNCAGILGAARTLDRAGTAMPLEAFARVIEVNLIGTFNCARLAAEAMVGNDPQGDDGERGVIVNTASIAAFEGQVGQVAYSASKSGIVGLTLPMARDLASVGIRVTTISPGLIDTPIYGTGEAGDGLKSRLAEQVQFPPRLGRPEEFAGAVVFVISNPYVNGDSMRIDGGVRLPPR